MRFETLAIRGAYDHAEALNHKGSICEPAYLTPAQHYDTSADMRDALTGRGSGWTYTRIDNPTTDQLESVIAMLEGYGSHVPVTTAVFSSGMTAIFMAANALLADDPARPKPNIVLPAACYGGSYMLFTERFEKDRGVEIRWVRNALDLDQWDGAIDANTRFAFCEVPSNPHLRMTDIAAVSEIVHARQVPLMVDATVSGPALLRPLTMGADIVVQSVSKSMSASGMSIAGAVSSKADIVCNHRRTEMSKDFAGYLKRGPRRDMGTVLSPFNALSSLADIRSLRSRTQIMGKSAARLAAFLDAHPKIVQVFYPGLESNPGHDIAKRDMILVDSQSSENGPQNCFGYLLSLRPQGGAKGACAFLDALKLIWRANDLGRIKSTATIPSISTHSQLKDDEKDLADIPADLVRISVGCEHIDDLIHDVEQALAATRVHA